MRHSICGRIIRRAMEYLLMYKNKKVLRFNVKTYEIELLDRSMCLYVSDVKMKLIPLTA